MHYKQYTRLGHYGEHSIFVFQKKKKYEIDLSNYNFFFLFPEINPGPVQVSGIGLFVKIVTRSITSLFLLKYPSVLEYAFCLLYAFSHDQESLV